MQDLMEHNAIAQRLKARFNQSLENGDLPSESLLELCARPKNDSVTTLPLFACLDRKSNSSADASSEPDAAGVPSRSEGAAAFRLRSKKSSQNYPFPPHTNRGVTGGSQNTKAVLTSRWKRKKARKFVWAATMAALKLDSSENGARTSSQA